MKKIVIIINLCLIFGSVPFKGYIKLGSPGKYKYTNVYAEGQYLDGLMEGEWSFYTDATKSNIISEGSYVSGDKSNPSQNGIPIDGRNGLWEHFYTDSNRGYNNKHMKNPLRATQYWQDGKLIGRFASYFKDGKIAVESDYKDGKRDGFRKEWYQGGYMYTNLFRETQYKDGNPLTDKMYNYDTNLYLISTYKDDIRLDTLYSSNHNKKILYREIKDGYYHGDLRLYHPNGKTWIQGTMKNGSLNGDWEEFSAKGTLIAKMRFDMGYATINDGEESNIYDDEGKLIYSYVFNNDKRNGPAVEMLHLVPNIIHNLELNKISSRRCTYSYSFYDYKNQYSLNTQRYIDRKNPRNIIRPHSYSIWIPSINYSLVNNYQSNSQYQIYQKKLKGILQTDNANKINPKNKIIGRGSYKDNIRVGEWIWRTIDADELVLKGQYNQMGVPVGEWTESDPKNENNLIITKYKENGKIESVSKRTITFSSK